MKTILHRRNENWLEVMALGLATNTILAGMLLFGAWLYVWLA